MAEDLDPHGLELITDTRLFDVYSTAYLKTGNYALPIWAVSSNRTKNMDRLEIL